MKLVIGGAFQGKTAAACRSYDMEERDFIDGRTCAAAAIFDCRGIHHFHEYIRNRMKEETAGNACAGVSETLASELIKRNPQLVIVCDELGSGIVPMEAFERRWREQTGRICCELAAAADSVLRVTAGIGVVIKEVKG